MNLIYGWLILCFFVTFVFCGVIDETRQGSLVRSERDLEENGQDCILESEDVPENTLLSIDENFSVGKKIRNSKQKRCPKNK